MEREKHLKGYYKSYIERWQQRKEPLQVKIISETWNQEKTAKLLKDHPEIKEKYENIPPQDSNAQEKPNPPPQSSESKQVKILKKNTNVEKNPDDKTKSRRKF